MTKPAAPDDLHLTRSLGFLLGDVSRLIRRRFDERADGLGLTRAQWRVLAQLRRREGINQSALAEILEIEPITLVRHIDRLVTKGLIERRPDPDDRRAWKLYLANEVRPTLDRLRELSEQTREEALVGIAPSEREKLIDQLITIKSNMLALEKLAPTGPPDITSDRPTRTAKSRSRSSRRATHGA